MVFWGQNFDKQEKERLGDPKYYEQRRNELTNTGKYDIPAYYDEQGRPRTISGELLLNYEQRLDNLYSTEQEYSNLVGEDDSGDGVFSTENDNSTTTVKNKEKDKKKTKTRTPYRNPLRKIANGGVLQYPIDLDTDLQDYFEIQIFRYRAAGGLPGIKQGNQGYEKDRVEKFKKVNNSFERGGYLSASNRRGNRQNFRLQDLQSTIQLPMPPSLKDMNSTDFAGGTMSGLAAAMFGPTVQAFLGKGSTAAFEKEKASNIFDFRTKARNVIGDLLGVGKETFRQLGDAVDDKGFRRVTSLNAIAQAIGALGVNIDVEQAITRTSGAVRNPNLELLFKGPSLRSFSFNIRLTPRSPEESKRVRMIIRALKQHSAAKKNPQIFSGDAEGELGGNFLLGTPDVFKLRYIKARTQRDIKGLNKFKTCALTSIAVDYTGEVGRFAAYEEDSQPVTTIISLSFTELTPIYDQDYAEFTNDDDVGL